MSVARQNLPEAWRGRLRNDEVILWQGAPQEGFRFKGRYFSGLVGGIVALVFLSFNDTDPMVFWVCVLIVALIVIAPPVWEAINRHYSFFTLTNQRAFIGTDLPVLGKKLRSYPINNATEIKYEPGLLAAVYFAHKIVKGKYGDTRIDIGFDNLSDGSKVHDLIKQIKEGTI